MGEELHPDYGGCDGFGPNGGCSECTGLIEREDGSIVSLFNGVLVKSAPPTPAELAVDLVLAMASVKCKNKYPVGVIGRTARHHYSMARHIAKAIEAGTVETERLDAQHESAGRKALPDD